MKIAVPTAGGKLCLHFGHCEEFVLVETDAERKQVTNRQSLTPPPHEPGVLPKWLHEQGADMIIAGGMGRRAQQLFQQYGIEVIVGAPSLAPEELAEACLHGRLEAGENICDH